MATASEGASSGTISSMKRMMQRRRSACDATSRRGDLSPSRSCEAMQRVSAVVAAVKSTQGVESPQHWRRELLL